MTKCEKIQSTLTEQFLQAEYIQKRKSVRQISIKTGYVNSTILSYLEKFNIKRRTISEGRKNIKLRIILNKEFLKREYLIKKKAIATIANENKCSVCIVWRCLKEYGIKRRSSSEHLKGRTPANFKGRRKRQGYTILHVPNHPHRDRHNSVLEHRLVMEKIIKRYLKSEERVHHINGIKDDNRPENLRLFPNIKSHQEYHNKVYLFLADKGLIDQYNEWLIMGSKK